MSDNLSMPVLSEREGLSLGWFAAVLAVATLAIVFCITRLTDTDGPLVTQLQGRHVPDVQLEGSVSGFVDRAVTYRDGTRRVLAIDLWATLDSPITAVNFSSAEDLSVVGMIYPRSDLAERDGAVGITITVADTELRASDLGICISLVSAQSSFFVSEFPNCWSF